MRIAIATRYRERVGGVESYLETLLPALDRRGHALLLLSEDAGTTRPIALPDRATFETLSAGGLERAVSALAAWRPDVVFLQGMSEARYEAALVPIAKTALFLHSYHGTCISGTKTHAFPGTSPCVRVLGPGCLAQYFPRRCGGLSPVSMWKRYAAETAHKAMFEQYRQVVVLSEHMKREAVRHGVAADAVTVLAPPIDGPADAVLPETKRARLAGAAARAAPPAVHRTPRGRKRRPDLDRRTAGGRPPLSAVIDVVFAGDGGRRQEWEARAARHALGSPAGPVRRARSTRRIATGGSTGRISWSCRVCGPSRSDWLARRLRCAACPRWPSTTAERASGSIDERTGRLVESGRLDAGALADAIEWCATRRTADRARAGRPAQASPGRWRGMCRSRGRPHAGRQQMRV